MKYLLVKILPILIAGITIITLFATTPVLAAAKDDICEGVAITTSSGCDPAGANKTVDDTIRLAINILSLVVGIAAVIMIIVGGLKYILSSGDANNINSAKNTILYAIIGLVVVALAQVVVKFVLSKTP